jgi:hypothetical protein
MRRAWKRLQLTTLVWPSVWGWKEVEYLSSGLITQNKKSHIGETENNNLDSIMFA